ncbi:MAG TPA: DUF2059 domain-containing protein [Drouetiella sp.]
MRFKSMLLATLATVSICAPSFADAPAASTTTPGAKLDAAQISPEKKALIMDLLKTTNAEKSVDAVMTQIMAAHARQYPAMIEQLAAADKSLTDDQRKAIVEKARDSAQRSAERVRELFVQKVNMGDLMDKVALYVYDKNFDNDDLKNLIAFYHTSTGQKALRQMPEVLKESMDMTAQLVAPQMTEIIMQVMSEERARLKLSDGTDKPAATK